MISTQPMEVIRLAIILEKPMKGFFMIIEKFCPELGLCQRSRAVDPLIAHM